MCRDKFLRLLSKSKIFQLSSNKSEAHKQKVRNSILRIVGEKIEKKFASPTQFFPRAMQKIFLQAITESVASVKSKNSQYTKSKYLMSKFP